MTGLKPILSLVLVGALGFIFVWQYETAAKLRAENESLRRQIERLSQAQTTGTVFSNNSLTPEQISELLKLRGEVTQLRQETNEVASLRAQNQKLRASLEDAVNNVKPARTNAVAKSPNDALPQDIHPKDSWAFRGYGNPDATVESACWALANGDKAAYLAALAPEERADAEKRLAAKDFASEEVKSFIPEEFRILDRQAASDDETVLTVYFTHLNANGDSTGGSQKMVFDKIGGEWKATDKAPPSDR